MEMRGRNLNGYEAHLRSCMTAVAGTGQICEGASKARCIFGSNSIGKRHDRLLDHIDFVDRDALIKSSSVA